MLNVLAIQHVSEHLISRVIITCTYVMGLRFVSVYCMAKSPDWFNNYNTYRYVVVPSNSIIIAVGYKYMYISLPCTYKKQPKAEEIMY